MDFFTITKTEKKGAVEIAPEFLIKKSRDLMIRGGDFYAIWNEEEGHWSTDEDDAIKIIDNAVDQYVKDHPELKEKYFKVRPLHMRASSSGVIDRWHKYCQKQCRDSFTSLDETIIFSNDKKLKTNYASKCLTYPLKAGSTEAYDELMDVFYEPEERHKIEWSIGSIVSGESKELQKFLVLYGAQGTGKGTVIKIIEQLFDGYCAAFSAKALGQSTNAFALEPFKNNPLVAIDSDGILSRIEDNTALNKIVSHEMMTVNNKYEKQYSTRFKAFLIMGTNEPVKITNAKSGILRRLIDATTTGNKIPHKKYNELMNQIGFELGAIASKCLDVYVTDPDYYDEYIPINMMSASNDFFNFVEDSYLTFKEEDGVTLKRAWDMYKAYVDYAKMQYPYNYRVFKEELKNYFEEFLDRYTDEDGNRLRSYYHGFKMDKFETKRKENPPVSKSWIKLKAQNSLLDALLGPCRAQIAGLNEKPVSRWISVKTTLSELYTGAVHYVLPQDKYPNLICVDFDLKDEKGEKSLERNLEAASKWPKTYVETSKGGKGLHLYYFYEGDVARLAPLYGDDIEIKVFTGSASLRRKVILCNSIDVATINSGLPLKKERKTMIDEKSIKSEKALRDLIARNIRKEIHPEGTKPSIDFIVKILEDAYASDLSYDVSDLVNVITAFAASSTHNSEYCLKAIDKMHFTSRDKDRALNDLKDDLPKSDGPIVFYDIEIFPNLFLINWKYEGQNEVHRMINPKANDIEWLIEQKLVGFNCRRYDNHIIYAAYMGYKIDQLYKLSQRIINGDNPYFGEAYNISYTDVYDYAAKKQSLKKWEIELGIHHQELGLPWDQPVPEEMWEKVAEYCDNDVIATEAVWNATKGDFAARNILADLAKGIPNDTTNSLTTKIVFGKNRHPQDQFCYRNLALPVFQLSRAVKEFLEKRFPVMMSTKHGVDESILPYWPGYQFKDGKSTYRGEVVGEGGYVYAEQGIHYNVALLDVTSMHPHSTMLECLFGPEFTARFYDIVYSRVHIKHEAWDMVDKMLDGKLKPYIEKVKSGELSKDALSTALKIAINSVYGLTAAGFENPFRDKRNVDNIVAKRGALFMVDLKHAVQDKGFTVAHIKTDSIKIPNATEEIIQFVKDFGLKYGYTFEHEATYEKMCLVNDAVYIAKYADGSHIYKLSTGETIDTPWTATGTQFQVPYIFKTMFTGTDLTFDDFCETKSVTTSIYLDFNEELPDVTKAENDLKRYKEKLRKGDLDEELYQALEKDCMKDIEQGHNYIFVGKVGRFTPVKPGFGGGWLVREKDGKFYAVTGTKRKDDTPYRWYESEEVQEVVAGDPMDYVDRTYYEDLYDDAKMAIEQYGDFYEFTEKPNVNVSPVDLDEELPFA